MRPKTILLALMLAPMLALPAAPALANPCGFDESQRMVVVGYGVGATAIPADQKAKLAEFAETAKHRFHICVFAQVDEQGSDEANKRVAKGRADAVRRFLIDHGVNPETIKIAKQEKAFNLFGLLPKDREDDRRVYVSHD
jgi:outer membrane protein OmpA-like peptidoglycan-associated protein